MSEQDRSTGAADPAAAGSMSAEPAIRLGAWSFYFLAKLILYWRGLIGFHPLENLALAAFIVLPLQNRVWRRARGVVAIILAVVLLYYDSWLPALSRVLSQAALMANFSPAYLAELAGRMISWPVVALLVVAWVGFRLLNRYLRLGAITVLLMALSGLPVWQGQASTSLAEGDEAAPVAGAGATPGAAENPDEALRRFYANEAQKTVRFPRADEQLAYDIVILHICSLSWDDLKAVGLESHPLWANMDFLFKRFNSATSYSGPAAIQINRATCGQTRRQALYEPAPENCYLMPSLKKAGFETRLAMNHDGHFDDFLAEIRKQGVNAPLAPFAGIPIAQRSFDESPIYDDGALLRRWLDQRQKSPEPHVALFYNTISLHDGNKLTSGSAARLSSHESYKTRVNTLLDDINGFIDQVGKSGRRALVVVVPEHGAAYRGDKFQIAGLREIPSPAITLVPVGLKVVGPETSRAGAQAVIEQPTSYVALSQLLAKLVEKAPFGKPFSSADYTSELSSTDLVSENEGVTVMEHNRRFIIKQGSGPWKDYPSNAQ